MSETRKIYRLRDVLEVARSPIDMKDEEEYMLASIRRRNGGMFDRETKKGGEILTKTLNRVMPGSFVISKMQVVHGACGMAPLDFGDRCISASYASLLPTEPQRIDIGYLDAYATTKQSYDAFFRASHGVHIEKMTFNLEEWLNGEIELPPLPEQKKIAEILSGIDHFIEKAKKEVMKYESLKQATLYEYPLKYSSGQVLLHECANLQAGGTPDRGKSSFWDGNIPWVKTGEVNYNLITSTEECISEEGLQSSSARLLPKGSILMAMYGQGVTRGRVAKLGISAATNQACLAINSRTPEVGNDYLYWILASKYEHLRSQVQEGTQKNLSKGIVGDQIIPLLEGRRQEEFCKLCSNFDALIKLKRSEASALSKLKNSISSDLLSGRKRVSI